MTEKEQLHDVQEQWLSYLMECMAQTKSIYNKVCLLAMIDGLLKFNDEDETQSKESNPTA